MSRRHVISALLALTSVAVACTNAPGVGSSDPTIPALNAASTPLLPTTANALPAMDLSTYQLLLRQLRGTPVVVNFWGSWCGPCRQEAPDLSQFSARYGSQVQFLGVDIFDTHAGALAFIHEFGWRFPSVSDPNGGILEGLAILGRPATLFYDREGSIAKNVPGPISREQFQEGLNGIVS